MNKLLKPEASAFVFVGATRFQNNIIRNLKFCIDNSIAAPSKTKKSQQEYHFLFVRNKVVHCFSVAQCLAFP
jgi:hypothetical protein